MSATFLTGQFLYLCVFATVMKSMPAHILSMDMESASGPAVKHCVRTWDNSSSKLPPPPQKKDDFVQNEFCSVSAAH